MQRRFLAQRSVAIYVAVLEQRCYHSKQCHVTIGSNAVLHKNRH